MYVHLKKRIKKGEKKNFFLQIYFRYTKLIWILYIRISANKAIYCVQWKGFSPVSLSRIHLRYSSDCCDAEKNVCVFILVLTNFSWNSMLNLVPLIIVFVFRIHFFFFLSRVVTASCTNALGMESGAIADFQITASSAHDPGNVGASKARWVVLYFIRIFFICWTSACKVSTQFTNYE